MNIYKVLRSGIIHPTNGEDFLYHRQLDDRWLVAAVMDGCSSGKESYFASALLGKSLHKACRMLPNMKEIFPEIELGSMDNEAIGKYLLSQLFDDLKKIKRTLFLDVEELLSTLLLMVVDCEQKTVWVSISGDGFVACNGKTEEIDQQNMPDYIAYNLTKGFDAWFENHTETRFFEEVKDVSVATDGVGKIVQMPDAPLAEIDPVEFFLNQPMENGQELAMEEKLNQLLKKEGFVLYDDVSVIRVVFD